MLILESWGGGGGDKFITLQWKSHFIVKIIEINHDSRPSMSQYYYGCFHLKAILEVETSFLFWMNVFYN
jgi:hypothetical protein